MRSANAVSEGYLVRARQLLANMGHPFGVNRDWAGQAAESEQIQDTSCLITDVQMPGLSGLDLQDRLIARGHCIPIIFMTGYPNDNVRARAMKAGAVCFQNKPFSLDHFIGCIEKALKAA
jgi:FixJ family two-component response regulator